MRILTACVLLLLTGSGTAAAQPAGPYLAGQIGTSAGDGGAALMTGVAVGYMSPKRLAFELEISVSPSLDFDPPPVSILAIVPPRFESQGRMIWFQSNALGTLVDAGKLRVAVAGGGGVANLHREITYSLIAFTSVTIFPPTLPPPPIDFGERTITQSETALALNGGGIVDYELTRHLRIGADVRYMHAFFSEPWQAGRVTARVQWQF